MASSHRPAPHRWPRGWRWRSRRIHRPGYQAKPWAFQAMPGIPLWRKGILENLYFNHHLMNSWTMLKHRGTSKLLICFLAERNARYPKMLTALHKPLWHGGVLEALVWIRKALKIGATAKGRWFCWQLHWLLESNDVAHGQWDSPGQATWFQPSWKRENLECPF